MDGLMNESAILTSSGASFEAPPFYAHSKKGRGKMLTRIFGAVTGSRLNLRAAANSSASILARIPNETLVWLTVTAPKWYPILTTLGGS